MRPNLNRKTLQQVACLFLAAVALGLAGNALNPTGLRWGEANATHGPNTGAGTGSSGIYRNQTLYENETFSATFATGMAPASTQAVHPIPATASSGAPVPLRSTWAEVKPLVESGQAVLVDARPRTAFDAGHIPGAVCLPVKELDAEIQGFIAKYPPTTPLAIYCANSSCGTSSQLATSLTAKYNYKVVRFMPGGYQEWRKAEGQ